MYFVSDWAILNDAKSQQLQRVLEEFYHFSESEIHRACILLESYHAVYRRDWLEQRRNSIASGQARIKEPCQPPTAKQLHEIAQRVNAKTTLRLQTEDVVTQLQDLAQRLRQYSLSIRVGLRGTTSHKPKNRPKLDPIQSADFLPNGCMAFAQPYAF